MTMTIRVLQMAVNTNDEFSTVRRQVHKIWRELLPDVPILKTVDSGPFSGFVVYGTEIGIGLFEGQWILAHIPVTGSAISANAGPFDFSEQAVAALFAAVVHERALTLLRNAAFSDDA